MKTLRPSGAVMSSVSMQVLSPAEVRYISASPSTSALVTEFLAHEYALRTEVER